MKRNNLILFLVLLSFKVSAYEYQMTCNEKKLEKFENVSVNQSSDECLAFKATGYAVCFDSKKVNRTSDLITLSTPNDHYYQSKESTKYSRKKVQEIIDLAVKAGNDPYLTLAIVMTENPPIVSNQKVVDNLTRAESYATSFGNIPLDAIAVADTMGCDREQAGYGANGMIMVKNRKPRLKQFVENAAGTKHIVCMDDFTSGSSPTFFLASKPEENSCCMILTTKASGFIHEPVREPGKEDTTFSYPSDALRLKIFDMMAHKYMKNRFASAQEKAMKFKTPEERMAITAQSFNGFGKLGVTEGVKNQCLSKVHMGSTPIYGAGTSEIMVNSLMNNSEVKDMVTKSLTAQKKPFAESYLCGAYGSGTHNVSGYAFTNLLENYLGDRKGCPSYTNKLKNLGRFVKLEPKTATPSQESPTNGAKTLQPKAPTAN